MNGRYYASIFLHYRPVGWALSRELPRFAIPPWWANGLETRSNDDGEAFVRGKNDGESVAVTFSNQRPEGSGDVAFYWAGGQGTFVKQGAMGPGDSINIQTSVGHSFVARIASEGEPPHDFDFDEFEAPNLGVWTVTPGFEGRTIGILGNDPWSASDAVSADETNEL